MLRPLRLANAVLADLADLSAARAEAPMQP
jgi:hypothetical protein